MTETSAVSPMRHGRTLLGAALALACLLAFAPRAHAASDPLLPPTGKIFHGVAMGTDVDDFARRSSHRPDVWEHFVQVEGDYKWAIDRARKAGLRLVLHLSTAAGQNSAGSISPGEIAAGRADRWLVKLR